MYSFKVHAIVEYIKTQGQFPFDVEDVAEDLSHVLGFYEVLETLSTTEEGILKEDLTTLAYEVQDAEVARLVELDQPAGAVLFVDVAR